MHAHGSETYVIIGENDEPAGGPAAARATSAAGSASRLAPAAPFRFSRIGPKGKPLSTRSNTKIAVAMISGRGGSTGVPAGYTYLGQFLDHDLTFDRTQVMLGTAITPAELLQGRSPSLDLDSLYGAGPLDPESARFYTDDRHLALGRTVAIGPDAARDGFDLPRGAGRSSAAKRRAIIPDPRNDENLAVAQTHTAMIRFHNRVVDTLPASVPAAQRFVRARAKVVKHYQWMVRHDYLPRICKGSVVEDVFTSGRKVFEVGASVTDVPTMPVEFSVAAFRLGHSMVRSAYSWNRRFPDGAGSLDLLFLFSGTSGDLGGDVRLPSNWICDFRRLYPFAEAGRPDLAAPAGQENRAMRIDTLLVDPLRNLPTGSFGGPEVPFDDPRANLAFRNLTRAAMLRLATGQQMAALMQARGVGVTPLTRAQILDGRKGAELGALTSAEKDALATRTPLWFYVLREAELNRGKLDGVGARIVAETFHRAMEGSSSSIVRDTAFRPTLGPDDSTFRMTDLLLFAFQGKAKLLNPLGP
ncbi:peroxidase family protein [Nocardioides mesophilus]|uniref:Heme peroxidase n=1 Tax=Nocardioides mesophilus TaxID=433659 RepID=A0A7G9R7E1_9ACTN|nr:heme peroxidase family protein [Nocardioides mesophilus]QNN51516.1 heme peroxidase [Nocardioides mesophilus]